MNRHLKNSRFGASLMATVMMSGLMIEAAGATEVGAPRDPVWYIAKEKSLVGNDVVEEGAKVKYAGLPSENLEPTCDEGRRRAAEYKESNAARVKALISNHGGAENAVGDPTVFMKAFTEELARERAEHAAQMAALVEQNQQSALLLAEAAKNMAILAAAITVQPAAATGETPAAPAADANSTGTASDTGTAATGETKVAGETGAAPAKRTRG